MLTNVRDRAAFDRYRPKHSVLLPLGLAGDPVWRPVPRTPRVLAFGYWGRGKDPLPVIEATLASRRAYKLVIAGGSSHTRPGFIEQLRWDYAGHHRILITGYVPERVVPRLFHASSLIAFPYKDTTGSSAVLMQTCQYGRVPLLARLPLFESIVQDLDIHAYFYDRDEDLPATIDHLLGQHDELEAAGLHNYQVAQRLAMPIVADAYWRELEHGTLTETAARSGSNPVAELAQPAAP